MLTLVFVAFLAIGAALSAVKLLSKDLTMLEKIQSRRSAANEIPIAGSLTGKNASNGEDWPPRLAGGAQDKFRQIMLFPSHVTKPSAGIEYWQEVSSLVHTVKPDVKFISVCHPAEDCKFVQAGSFESLVFLTAMDLHDMRALAVAEARKVALLYEDSQLKKSIPIGASPQSMAEEIVNALSIVPRRKNEPRFKSGMSRWK